MTYWNKFTEVSEEGEELVIYRNLQGCEILRVPNCDLRRAMGSIYNPDGECIAIASTGAVARIDESRPELFELHLEEGKIESISYRQTDAISPDSTPSRVRCGSILYSGASPQRRELVAKIRQMIRSALPQYEEFSSGQSFQELDKHDRVISRFTYSGASARFTYDGMQMAEQKTA